MTERVYFHIPANLLDGAAIGGKLKITDSELIFTPHIVNIQRESIKINIGEMKEVQKSNSLFIVPNSMTITGKNEKKYKFVVNERDRLIDHLNQAISE